MQYIIESPLFKRFLVVTSYICATSLYTIIFVPENIRNAVEIIPIGLILLYLLVDYFSGKNKEIQQNFKFEIYLFLLALFFSMFMAKTFHGQDFTTTIIAQRSMYFYFFYFFLHSLKLRVEYLDRIIIPLAFVYIVIWLTQYILHPTLIVDSRVDPRRGTIRTFIPGGSFLVLAYYKSLQSFLQNHKSKNLLICLIIFAIHGILQGTRQSFGVITLLTTAYIFFSNQVRSKGFIILLAAIAGIAIFIIFNDVFSAMLQQTEGDLKREGEDIRITAMRFFVIEFQQSWLTYIFGSGADSANATYGIIIRNLREFGLHRSDIGLFGDYSKFGVLFVIAQLSIMLRIIFGKLPKELAYFRYYFISRLLVSFTGSNMFSGGDGIVFIGIVLYMIDYHKSRESQNISSKNEVSQVSST